MTIWRPFEDITRDLDDWRNLSYEAESIRSFMIHDSYIITALPIFPRYVPTGVFISPSLFNTSRTRSSLVSRLNSHDRPYTFALRGLP